MRLKSIGEWGDDSISDGKDLDPRFLLKTDLILISFSAEVNFFEESIFFVASVSPVTMESFEDRAMYGSLYSLYHVTMTSHMEDIPPLM